MPSAAYWGGEPVPIGLILSEQRFIRGSTFQWLGAILTPVPHCGRMWQDVSTSRFGESVVPLGCGSPPQYHFLFFGESIMVKPPAFFTEQVFLVFRGDVSLAGLLHTSDARSPMRTYPPRQGARRWRPECCRGTSGSIRRNTDAPISSFAHSHHSSKCPCIFLASRCNSAS